MTSESEAVRAGERAGTDAAALLAALPGQVAVVGHGGTILAVNAGWQRFARHHGLASEAAGSNYLAAFASARGEGAGQALAGVRAVLAGAEAEFTLDYPCDAPGQQRWLRMQVVPVPWEGERAALVTHTDITAETLAARTATRSGAHLMAAEWVAGFGTFRGNWEGDGLRQVSPSRGMCELLGVGWRPQPLPSLASLFASVEADRSTPDMELALREFGAFYGTCTIRRRGVLRDLEIHAHRVEEEGRDTVLGVVRDVTGERVHQAAQAQSRAVLRLAGASIGSWAYDRSAGGFVVSAEISRALALPPQRALRAVQALRLFAPHHRQLVLQSMRTAWRTGGVFDVEAQVQVEHVAGTWVRLTGEVGERPFAPQGALHVIDDRRKADTVLRETHQTLQFVSRCHEVLVRARDQVQLLAGLCEAAVDAGDYLGAWIAVPEGEGLRAEVMVQVPDGLLTPEFLAWNGGVVAAAVRRKRLQFVPSVAANSRYRRWSARHVQLGIRGLVAVPLLEGELLFGVLVLYLGAERVISDGELETLAHVGRDAGFSIAALRARADRRVALRRVAEQAEILDKAHDAIVVRGMDYRVLYWNYGAEQIYGWSAAEAVGRDVRDLVFGHSSDSLTEQLLRTGSMANEQQARRKDGALIWVHATWTLLRGDDARPDRVLTICTDITLRKNIAEALARSRAMLETAQSLARLAGVEIDLATGGVHATSAIVLLLGLQHGPRTIEDLAAPMTPASAEAFLRAMRDTGNAGFEMELELRAAAGRRWVRALSGAAGGRGVSTVVFQDITAIRDSRDEVLRLNASLERRVQRRTRQLQAANRELGAFSYSVSHDLKAPLAAIDGFTHVLSERLKNRLDPREAGYMERVRAGVANMFSLIDAMLTLHQISRDTALDRTTVDVSALAARIVGELRDAEPERASVARIEPGLSVCGDARLLENAVRNLIGNSWKFSAQKPLVELEIAADPDGPEGFATLRFADRGAGFEPALADKLFAPFQRLHHASEFPGTGVGLATVQRIVQRHGGMIRADAVPGEGATFWLSFPLPALVSADSVR